MTDHLSPYTNFCLDTFSGAAFQFTPPASATLFYDPTKLSYLDANGSIYTPPVFTGCDGKISRWQITPLTGTLLPTESFTLRYKVQVK